jgi:hypothetical protein
MEQRQRHYAAGKDGQIKRARMRRKEDPETARCRSLRGGMFERSRKCGVSFDREFFTVGMLRAWLRRQTHCECCAVAFDVSYKLDGQKKNNSPSVDRILPARGYVMGNVALICWRCNNLKRDATAEELECVAAWIRKKTTFGDDARLWGQEAALC